MGNCLLSLLKLAVIGGGALIVFVLALFFFVGKGLWPIALLLIVAAFAVAARVYWRVAHPTQEEILEDKQKSNERYVSYMGSERRAGVMRELDEYGRTVAYDPELKAQRRREGIERRRRELDRASLRRKEALEQQERERREWNARMDEERRKANEDYRRRIREAERREEEARNKPLVDPRFAALHPEWAKEIEAKKRRERGY